MIVAALSILLLIGAAIGAVGVRNAWRAAASRGWPTVPGVVVASARETHVTYDQRSNRSSKAYGSRVRVRYAVGGAEYETEQRRFGQIVGTTDPSDAALLVLRYPSGAPVTVAYDPAHPSRAVMEPGLFAEALWLPAAGLAFVVAGALSIVLFLGSVGDDARGMALGLTLFGLVFCAIGAALLTPGAIALWRARASAHWPSAPGTIVMGRPAPLPVDADDAAVDSAESADSASGRVLQPGRLVYAYDVRGRRHYANVRTFGQVSRGGGGPDEAIGARYPIGRAVTVRHAPDAPDLAVLEPGVSGEAWLLPGVGAAFLLFGFAVIRWGVPSLAR